MHCLVASLLVACIAALPAHAQTDVGPADARTIAEEAAHTIGVDAYLYFYPLVTMDITRKLALLISSQAERSPRAR